MKYHLQKVANGWMLSVIDSPGSEPEVYVFENVHDLAIWLADRHGEPASRRLVLDWHT